MTIAQINSTKTEFTFVTKCCSNETVHSCNGLLGAKKNFNKRCASNDGVKEIEHYLGNKKFVTIVPNVKRGYTIFLNQTQVAKCDTLKSTHNYIMHMMD